VISNQALVSGVYILSIRLKLSDFPTPGAFLHIRPWSAGTDPLLRRAFSIYDYDESSGIVDVLYKVFGRGSQLLSGVTAGETLDVLGPLGNGFDLPKDIDHLVLVAGGVGIPPVYLLAKSYLRQGFASDKISYFCGLTTAKERAMARRVEKLSINLQFSTDDGSFGYKGLVSELLRTRLNDGSVVANPVICACGPNGMLKAIQTIAKEHGCRCFLSLESIMPCGVGTCLGCVVKKAGKEQYLRVCREGPVFDASEVEL
jgi:dihydroorotate dehydrogenase electron transfer subunit